MIKVLDEKTYHSQTIYLICELDHSCQVILVSEGTGDNLLYEDIKAGYTDYLNYELGSFDGESFVEDYGGMMLFKEMIADREGRLVDFIEEILADVGLKPKNVYVVNAE